MRPAPCKAGNGESGVRLIFENSTVCNYVDGLVCMPMSFGLGIVFRRKLMILAMYFVRVCFLLVIGFSMESLILAQDERWRRA